MANGEGSMNHDTGVTIIGSGHNAGARTPADTLSPVPDVQRLEALRATLAAKLYAEMVEPASLRAFRELLRSPDRRVRLQAWELALRHGWPVKEAKRSAVPRRWSS
jgi:hypothetical protein